MAKTVYVSGYYRNDGTYVKGYYRTAPDSTKNNNYSTIGNTNPFTGEAGTKPGGQNSTNPSGSSNYGSSNTTNGNNAGGSGSTGSTPNINRILSINVNGNSLETEMSPYVGPVSGLQNMHIGTDENEAMVGTEFSDFINSLGGNDAINGGGGNDVLDGGTGSNFLTGGTGVDTFFIDGRSEGVTWSTITDLEKGEWVTAWGWKQGTSKLTWEEMNGAENAKGATAHIDLDNNGTIDMSITFTGKTPASLLSLPGEVNGTSYLAFILS